MREAVGPDAKLRLDANGSWSVDEALGVLRMVEPLGVELLEQPVATSREMTEITSATSVLVAADEIVATAKDAERAKRDAACDLATVKLSKTGGIGEANGIARSLPIYLSSALDGPLGIAAAAHAAQVLPATGPAAGLAHGLATQLLFKDTVATRECTVADGLLTVPAGPGLGVELDDEALAKARIIAFASMDATNRNTALATAMVEELARCGMREAVICPGSRSTPLALALWREPGIEVRVIVDERSAGFFALGAAQATGAPVAVLTTSGTAAANLHPAVCEADESGVPLIALTADRPPELRGIGAGQTIDQLKLYGEAVRWFCEVGTHDADDAGLLHFRSVACRAFWTAAGDPRPGPVHLNVPWRDPLGPEPRPDDVTATSALALDGRDGRPLTTIPPAPSPPPPALVEALGERLAAAKRGLIVCGRMAPGAEPDIAALAAAAGFPDPRRANLAASLRPARPLARDRRLRGDRARPARPARARPRPEVRRDADLQAPAPVAGRPRRRGPPRRRSRARVERADPDRRRDRSSGAGAAGRGAGGTAGRARRPRTAGRTPGSRRPTPWRPRSGASSTARARPPSLASSGRSAKLLADGDLVYTASSMPIRDQEAFLPGGDADVRFLANRGANGIDGLISSGIGAAVATGRPAWIVTGDLGLFHDMNALAALRHADVPVRIVVVNNDGGGIFEFLPQAGQIDREEFEGVLGTPLGLEPERVAALHGIDYARLDALDELAGVAAGTALVEVRTDRAENLALHRGSRNGAGGRRPLAAVAAAPVTRLCRRLFREPGRFEGFLRVEVLADPNHLATLEVHDPRDCRVGNAPLSLPRARRRPMAMTWSPRSRSSDCSAWISAKASSPSRIPSRMPWCPRYTVAPPPS